MTPSDKYFLIDEPTVISFSGGRTSAYMLWRVLQANQGLPEEALVCFANTGKEEEATLEFVRDCEKNWGVEIHWLEFRDADPAFKRVTFETASRNGEPFEALIRKRKYLPNPVTRFCTAELKIRTIAKYLFDLGFTEKKSHGEDISWVGIRADEERRAAKIEDKSRIPLWSAGVTKHTVGDFWQEQSFDLKLPNINGQTYHGNCDLCFLKGSKIVQSLVQEKPERAIWWAKMEKEIQAIHQDYNSTGAVFRFDRLSYSQMLNRATNQQDMFPSDDETIPCFCGD
jgi:3'-phosphoadenosine 5'-phosphosulfate sulfotransferase (PAPS reductase)/FAD synthetase